MTKKLIFLGLLLSLAGCDRAIHKAPSEMKQLPAIILSCAIEHGGYDVFDGKRRYMQGYTKNTLIYVRNDTYISAEKPLAWSINYEDGESFRPALGDDPKQEGHPWWLTTVDVSDFEIFAVRSTGYKKDIEKSSSIKTLKINRATGALEGEFKISDSKGWPAESSVFKQRGVCQKAEQKF